MKQHATYVTMLLAAVCGGAVQRVGASYSHCLSASNGASDTAGTCGVLVRPVSVIGTDRKVGTIAFGGMSHGSYTMTLADVRGRYVTLDILCVSPLEGSRRVPVGLWCDGHSTGRGDATHRIPFGAICTSLFTEGDGAFSPWDSNSGRIRLDGVHFKVDSRMASVPTDAPASLSARYGSDRAAATRATAMIFSSPGAVLLSGLGVVLIGQQRRRTLL